jgi:hypothetical protein
MKLFECYARSAVVEAENEDDARRVFADLLQSDLSSEFIFAHEIDEEVEE